jgi:hypothetical protein
MGGQIRSSAFVTEKLPFVFQRALNCHEGAPERQKEHSAITLPQAISRSFRPIDRELVKFRDGFSSVAMSSGGRSALVLVACLLLLSAFLVLLQPPPTARDWRHRAVQRPHVFLFPEGSRCRRMNDKPFFRQLLTDVIANEPRGPLFDQFALEDHDDYMLGECISEAIGHVVGLEDTGKGDPSHRGALGAYHKDVADGVVAELERTGVTKVPIRLPTEWIEKMLAFLRDDMEFETRAGERRSGISFDWDKPVAKAHWGIPDSLAKLSRFGPMRDLLVDPTILDIAQRYLKAPPINAQVSGLPSLFLNTAFCSHPSVYVSCTQGQHLVVRSRKQF